MGRHRRHRTAWRGDLPAGYPGGARGHPYLDGHYRVLPARRREQPGEARDWPRHRHGRCVCGHGRRHRGGRLPHVLAGARRGRPVPRPCHVGPRLHQPYLLVGQRPVRAVRRRVPERHRPPVAGDCARHALQCRGRRGAPERGRHHGVRVGRREHVRGHRLRARRGVLDAP